QRHPGRAGPLRAGGAEVRAQVAQAGGGQYGVAGRVRHHVAVGVPGQPVDALPEQPGDPALPSGLVRVYVGTHPDDRNDHVRSSRCAATARSNGRVILNAASSPGTVHTGTPIFSASPASSVWSSTA